MSTVRMMLADHLGGRIEELLSTKPFSAWEVTRSIEEDLPKKEIWYEFTGHGVEVICDATERVRTIFLHRGANEALSELPFSSTRREVLERLGSPQKSGSAVRIPTLGNKGAWDRFAFATAVVHVEYRLDRDEVEMVTLMVPDAMP